MNFLLFEFSEIFADENEDEEDDEEELAEDGHLNEYDDEDMSEDVDESDEMDDEGEETEISSEDDENLIHTNGIKKLSSHLGITSSLSFSSISIILGVHQSDVDLLDMDGPPPNDSYLQTMNDNLHKKFRRPNHQYSSIHPMDQEYLHINSHNPIYHQGQLNGDYKNTINKPTIGNGQSLATSQTGGGGDDDDDDDIVLVSDDDSGENKPETKPSSMFLFVF